MPALLASPHGPVPALHGEMARAYSQILQDRWRSIRRQGLTPSAPRRAAPRPCPRPGVLCGHSGRPRAARLGALGQWSHVLVVRGWRLLQAPGTPGPGGFNSLRLVAGCVGPGILLAGSGRQQVCRTFGPCPCQHCLSLLVRGTWTWSVPLASGQQPAAGRCSAPGRVALGVRGWLPPIWGQHLFFLALPLGWRSL